MQIQNKRRFDRRKVMAIAAGGLVLGVGASVTLAAWTDTEWVFGGNGDDGPGIGTSTFEVQQSTVAPFTAFTDEEENPGGEIVFLPDALDLTPGDTVYASVALRTTEESVGGMVTLAPAVPAEGIDDDDPDGILFGALDLRVATDDAPFGACYATAFGAGATIIADGPLEGTGGNAAQELDAEADSTQHYCFEITLPELADGEDGEDLMGLSVAPAWAFNAESMVEPLP